MPNQGEVYFLNNKINYNQNDYKRYIGYCPDYPAVFEKLTVFEHLNFIAYLYGMKDEGQIKEAIDKYLEHYEMEESASQKQRGNPDSNQYISYSHFDYN